MLKLWDQPPHITYKHLLDKGEDLTTGEVVYLLNKEVFAGKIAKAANMTIQEVREIANRSDRYIENHKKVVMEMGIKKHEINEQQYKNLKAQGKSDAEIALSAGMSQSNLSYHKKKWTENDLNKQPKIAPVKTQQSEDYEKLMAKLKRNLEQSEITIDEKQSENLSLEMTVEEMEKEKAEREALIGRLENKITELEEQVNNLHLAAEDVEKEVAASHEYIEREQELMEDSAIWKQQALQYKAENERLNNTLSEERQEKEKYKGESLAFRLALKAVL